LDNIRLKFEGQFGRFANLEDGYLPLPTEEFGSKMNEGVVFDPVPMVTPTQAFGQVAPPPSTADEVPF